MRTHRAEGTGPGHRAGPGTALSRRRVLGLLASAGPAAVAVGVAGCAGDPPAPVALSPRPDRPRIALDLDVSDDLATVTGRESVAFTPDLPVGELVFRAWPNRPGAATTGTSLTVTGATVGGRPVEPRTLAAGAREDGPGSLVEIPAGGRVEPGTTVFADLTYTLRLGADVDERFGHSPSTGTAWFGSGHPMLAWVDGRGWARDDAVAMAGETATSEAAEFRIAVTAPEGCAVTATGTPVEVGPGPRPGTRTHRFRADAVRDVAVALGRHDELRRDLAGGVTLHLLTPSDGTTVTAGEWADALDDGVAELTALFGAFPTRELSVAIAPSQSSGIEFPGALQFGDVEASSVRPLVVHELAHQWFYGLVGNNQARHPWLDEAFATYAEVLVTGKRGFRIEDLPDRHRGSLGDPMDVWSDRGGFAGYYEGVYRQGAAVLLAAREIEGAARFDGALRRYLAAHAHRVAYPEDVAAAFDGFPGVVDLLTEHGALPART